jgi:cytoplasmic iron level regulating protein YaaA (DUF328/UPF0246 family)
MSKKRKIALISCVSKKLPTPAEAYKLYSPSSLFKAHWNYAINVLKLNPINEIYIISALHGLVSPLSKIEPYNVTLKTMSPKEKQEWAKKVLSQLKEIYSEEELNNIDFLILAGKDYYQELIKLLPNYKLIPEKPLPIGKRVQWFQNQIKKGS